jgi:hypothetical protein
VTRRKQATITIRPGSLVAGHIRNRAKRLGITIREMVVRAVLRVSDDQLGRY